MTTDQAIETLKNVAINTHDKNTADAITAVLMHMKAMVEAGAMLYEQCTKVGSTTNNVAALEAWQNTMLEKL